MIHSFTLITTIAASLGLALILGLIADRLKLPALVGYLLAGVVIGPYTPGFVADLGLSSQLAEIGVILLMFGVGLHFSLQDLLAVRRIALPGAIVQIVVATLLGAGVALYWGWTPAAAVVFGLALSVASTVVLIRALEQRRLLQSVNGRIAVGWLVVEDLVMVLVLVLLPPLSGWLSGTQADQATFGWEVIQSLLLTLGKIAVFIGLILVIGKRMIPWLMGYVADTGSRELFTLTVIALAMGVAFGSAELFGVSLALGAFFAGMVMRESPLSQRAAEESLPFRDAFSVLFFVSVGMLFDPRILVDEPLHVLAVVAIIVLGKSIASFLLVLLFRYPLNTALTVSASLAQIGEFSFILAGLGISLNVLPPVGLSYILAGALISIAVNHLVFQTVEPVQAWVRARSKLARRLERRVDPLAELPMTVSAEEVTGHVVLVGYGKLGRLIGEGLAASGVRYVVADQNRELVEKLRAGGQHAVAGDAADPAVLIQAHIARAAALVVTTKDLMLARQMVNVTRKLNPRAEILLRGESEVEAQELLVEQAGAVFMPRHELARGMTAHVLEKIGRRKH